ncbi:hypothetical protein HK099_000307 [Clydaea vesicula]|uniref:Uncharacterized protein n=1 Tax=Clydaea vesicula TaxID=447962 RepID=A0AAD5TXE6_9FUNG|nr:hypothetical protein HK099_000307 [Clydaea vesicula]KAJ3377253.1 hypothetical protein HDU92_008491 [Lobulomyces angularis]
MHRKVHVHESDLARATRSNNHAGSTYKSLLNISSSVIPQVILPSLCLTVWAALVTVFVTVPGINFLNKFEPYERDAKKVVLLPTSPILISILSIVIGLLLVFRTNTAYDRFWSGRGTWGDIKTYARNLGRLIWINSSGDSKRELTEKKAAINLIYAFATSLKHMLRSEDFLDYEDLAPYLAHLPEYHPEKLQNASISDSPVPLELTFHISTFINKLASAKQIDGPTQTQMVVLVNNLIACLTNLERIRNSPIPLAYSIHLKQALLLYLVSLPFQIVISSGWYTIPVMLLATFTLLGIEAVGGQIENPFGYDPADLPLDLFCDEIKMELAFIIEKENSHLPKNWLDPLLHVSGVAVEL